MQTHLTHRSFRTWFLRFITLLALVTWLSAAALPAPALSAPQESTIYLPAVMRPYSATPPAQTVKLIFIHHSTGENWLGDDYGGLGAALAANNYFVSDTNYGWGPNAIGDRTDILNWREWFRSADTPTYMSALYAENQQHASYTRLESDPGGANEVVMFKSCFPNSQLAGSPNDPPAEGAGLTVGNARFIYNDLLNYFKNHPEKLFVVITAPPVQDGTYADNARAFNNWLVNNWLIENRYPLKNVAVFDFYNVLTHPENHHRIVGAGPQDLIANPSNTLYYPSGDDHPNQAGSQKATTEFLPLLNFYYNRWKADSAALAPAPEPAQDRPPTESVVPPPEGFATQPRPGEDLLATLPGATGRPLAATLTVAAAATGAAAPQETAQEQTAVPPPASQTPAAEKRPPLACPGSLGLAALAGGIALRSTGRRAKFERRE